MRSSALSRLGMNCEASQASSPLLCQGVDIRVSSTAMSAKSRKPAKETPFYELPNVTTSADIIAAARHSIRTVDTRRPETPKEGNRTLFGDRSTARPPSSYHINKAAFKEPISRSTTLSPIESLGSKEKLESSKTNSPVLETKNAAKAEKGEKVNKENKDKFNAYWKAKIAPILDKLNVNADSDNVDVLKEVDDLLECLLRGGFLTGAVALPQQYRVKVFQCVINLLENKNTKLLLKIARILLCLGVYDKNLTSMCKLVFKLTRCEENDALFVEERIVFCLLDIVKKNELVENPQAYIYGVGALKVLTANSDNGIGEVLAQAGCIQALEQLLVTCNESDKLPKEMCSGLLVQILGALRNLSEQPGAERFINESAVFHQLQFTLSVHSTDAEVLLNGCRLLSRLSLNNDSVTIIGNTPGILTELVSILKNFPHDTQLVLRSCFVLGNVTARHDQARLCIYQNCDYMDSMIAICKNFRAKLAEKGTKQSIAIVKDVLAKTSRLIANVCQSEAPAQTIGSELLKLLLSLCQMSCQGKCKEILVNILAALNNISYYSDKGSDFMRLKLNVTETLVSALTIDDIQITGEVRYLLYDLEGGGKPNSNIKPLCQVVRVLGNLTQHPEVCTRVCEKQVVSILCTLLDSDDGNLVYGACGVLTNVMSHCYYHQLLPKDIITKCTEVLKDVGSLDVELCTVTCHLLWNIVSPESACPDPEQISSLLTTLLHYTDPEYCTEPMPLAEQWDTEFNPVAKRLVGLLNNSELEPL